MIGIGHRWCSARRFGDEGSRPVALDGVFSHEWVMGLVEKYFEIPAHVRQEVAQGCSEFAAR